VPNGIDTERFTPGDQDEARRKFGLPRQTRLIGCAARLHPVKGHRFLLDALAALPGDVHLALAGDGEEASALEGQARRLGIDGRVHFLDRVDDMPDFYRALDAFCLPSLCEGLPLSTLEAQSSGIPVVVTDAGGSPESACTSSGRVVPAGDVDALAGALRSVLDAPPDADPRSFVKANGDVRAMSAAYAALCD
jgi:glycosyltransferase involved in cell wall biosynthesis